MRPIAVVVTPQASPFVTGRDRRQSVLGAGQAQLVGDTLRAVRWESQGVVEDLLLDLGCDPVRMRMPQSALLFYEGGHPADLEGPAHLVEGVAAVAHDLTGL